MSKPLAAAKVAACGTTAPAKPGVPIFCQQWLASAGAAHWFALWVPAKSCGHGSQVPTHILQSSLLEHTRAQALSCPAQVTAETSSAVQLSRVHFLTGCFTAEGVMGRGLASTASHQQG